MKVVAETFDEAQAIARTSEFYANPENAKWAWDDENVIDDVYLPDPDDYEVHPIAPKP